MEVKIGVQYAARELVVETNESVEAIESAISSALGQAGEEGSLLALTDAKGKRLFVPAAKITYVEIGTTSPNAVGFRS
ncbi:MAG: DUF3107 domain-containing protein [Nocardioides sp.]|uniref:DUF3107 domain-containing protein n=1 Tax=Nocardioides sp. TaxID=35761 RepID=UPI0039E3608A